MRTKLLKIFTVVLMAATALGSAAQDFSVGDLMYKVYGDGVYCTGLTSAARGKPNLAVIIPSSVSYNSTTYRVNGVNANSFTNCTNIVSVTMRFGAAFIESNAFNGCTGITYVRLPSSIKGIYSNAFAGCTALNEVYYAGFTFPSHGVNSSAFPSNSNMKLYIPAQSHKTPAQYKAQTGFTQFSTVSYSPYAYDIWMVDGGTYSMGWPDNNSASTTRSATLIGYASSSTDNTSNGTVYKPTGTSYSADGLTFSIDTIGTGAFQWQSSLKTIDLTKLTNLKYFAYQNQNSGIQNVTKLVLPPSSFNFSASTFLYFSSLAAFELASGSYNYSIYDGCLYNKSQTYLYKVPDAKSGTVSYPSTLTTVWSWSHAYCTKIVYAILPYGVKNINVAAFYNTTSLDYVRIPSSVTNLSNDRVFYGTKSNNYIYCNMDNPPTVTASTYFGNNSNMHLYIPYGKESTYSSAGWTGFLHVNYEGRQAYDYPNISPTSSSTFIAYTVTSNASATGADGNSYGGRARVVCNGVCGYNGASSVTIPASVTIGSKTYVVNRIGNDAFNNHTTTNFTVQGCVNIDTIGDYAFQNQKITSYAFTHNLRKILNYAFDGAAITGTICLPYGVSHLGGYSFGHGKYSRLVVPSSLSYWYYTFCRGTTTLTELVLNKNTSAFYNSSWDFTDVPATCKILVPTGVVNQYKQNSALSSRASYISAGAYDFAYSNSYSGTYFMTIISNSSTTYNGTTYAGKAKYVYHPNIQTATSGKYLFATYESDVTVDGDSRKYLITEIGDSLLYGSKYTDSNPIPAAVTRIGQSAFRSCQYAVNNLVLPSGLTYIGHDAFYASKITGEIKIPSSVTTIESYAFNTSTLGSLYFPDMTMPTMGSYVWYSGIGTVWVPNGRANSYLTKANSWGTNYGDRLAPWIKPYATTQMFSSVLPTNLSGSNISAYYASDYNKSDTGKEVRLTKINQAPPSTGMLLVDLNTQYEYRISRPANSVSAPATNYLVATPSASVNVYSQTVGYYWEYRTPNNLRFVRPTTNYNTTIGGAYLKLSSSEASGKSEVYTTLFPKNVVVPGDVNGDGIVSSVDVTALYNYLLNGDSSAIVNGDQDGDGIITSVDVTIIYNILLGN